MKKILLIIAIAFCIFQMVVLATAIDVGCPATDRGTSYSTPRTCANLTNPANLTGKITTIKIWANTDMGNCKVATFYSTGGNNLSTRDWETIGAVTAGAERTFVVDLDVVAGDYIGYYDATGKIEADGTGYSGTLTTIGADNIPCTDVEFTPDSALDNCVSLYGTGETVGWPHKWNTITIGKWNTKEFTKWNGLE